MAAANGATTVTARRNFWLRGRGGNTIVQGRDLRRVLEESGELVLVPSAQINLADTAIAGAVPGMPSLPKTIQLARFDGWSQPPDDPIQHVKSTSGENSTDDNQTSSGGFGCTLGGRARSATTMAPLAALAVLLLLARRRTTAPH